MKTAIMITAAALLASAGAAWAGPDIPAHVPDACADLRTTEGVAAIAGAWHYREARVVAAENRAAGPDHTPMGSPLPTSDISPRGSELGAGDEGWEPIDPTTLEQRRTHGRLAFGWYRFSFTMPERVGSLPAAGATAVLEITADDYAEVWVGGKPALVLGQSGGPAIKGWNTPTRVVLTHDAKPGERLSAAIFVANGPLSDPPANYVWMRSATLDFYAPGRWMPTPAVALEVDRRDPAIDAVVPSGTVLEKLADGFVFTEGPVWHPDGYLLFSDPNTNVIHRWTPHQGLSVYRTKSGYSGLDIGRYRQAGSNGLALDAEGRVTICEHGNRRVTRLERNGTLTVLADRYEGKRLNSPNDLVYRSDGTLYFTDPPFGLPGFHDDPARELPHSGVYSLKDGRLRLVSTDLRGPNGLAFSPDQRTLYVANWDEKRKIVMRYDAHDDGTLGTGSVFFDMTDAPGEEALDGLKVDSMGRIFVSGPGGVWVLSPEGTHLGTIKAPELAANMAFGDADRRTLYLAARTGLYRMRLPTPGR